MTGKDKLCEKMKTSLNILSKIVWRLSFYFLILWKYMQTLNLSGVVEEGDELFIKTVFLQFEEVIVLNLYTKLK